MASAPGYPSARFAARVAVAYAGFGVLWIAVSDRLLEVFVGDPRRLTLLQTYKGWVFVGLSALVLYGSAQRELRRRKLAEEALRGSETLYRALAEASPDLIVVVRRDGEIEYVNRAGARYFGRAPADIVGRRFGGVYPPAVREAHVRQFAGVFESGLAASFEGRFSTPTGEVWFDTLLSPIRGVEGDVSAVLGVAREITERKRAQERIDLQLQRLSALHTIDTAITSSLDLGLTFEVVLANVTSMLHADAAAVLLLKPPFSFLEYAAARGFRTDGIKSSRLRLGEGYAGVAALERRTTFVRDLAAAGPTFVRAALFEGEDFVAYHAVPLVAKGEVKGVLELFHRARVEPDSEWLGFLDAIAARAAVAIDNGSLFENLQRSNTELTLAYDATLEGWGRALELRDQETEGHTERVTAQALKLARKLGLPEEEMVHLRRGSFLHDIGKIGIPDRVLLKPEPLTAEEWAIMRLHPVYAFRLLQPIRFLRPALDVPYCHHERWDGSGYPRGLQGEQIPLAARIFAVVDVWDALRSPRSYHEAWPEEAVRAHLRALSGTHFDSRVVEEFLKLEGIGESGPEGRATPGGAEDASQGPG